MKSKGQVQPVQNKEITPTVKPVIKSVTQQVIFKKCAKTEKGYIAHGGIGDTSNVKMGNYKISGGLSGFAEVLQNGINVIMTFEKEPVLHVFYTLQFD